MNKDYIPLIGFAVPIFTFLVGRYFQRRDRTVTEDATIEVRVMQEASDMRSDLRARLDRVEQAERECLKRQRELEVELVRMQLQVEHHGKAITHIQSTPPLEGN